MQRKTLTLIFSEEGNLPDDVAEINRYEENGYAVCEMLQFNDTFIVVLEVPDP